MAQIDIDGGVPATTLLSGITSGDTSFSLADSTGWMDGAGGDFYVVLDRGLSTEEVIQCASRAGSSVTVATSGRGADGTSAVAHDAGATIEHCVPALSLQESNTHANQTTGTPHGTAYLTTSNHASINHTAAMIGAGEVGNSELAASGLDISKFTTGTSDRDTTGNAATATTAAAWTTPRNITFTGDATGTLTGLDGSANGSVALTVGSATPEAHTHDGGDIDAGTITSLELATDSVGSDEIASGAVGTGEIANGAVIAAKAGFAWSTHSPAWGGTTLFTGNIINNYFRFVLLGDVVHYRGRFSLAGSADITGAIFSVDLPVDANTNYRGIGTARYYDSSGGSGNEHFVGVCSIVAADELRFYTSDAGTNGEAGGIVGASVPFNWASGDSVEWFITYEAA